ncbi:MAG: hypothetical protein HY225_03970 [Candidatus Vogelbacteria bacterium]|nr:hypothetical protein [Candidatus Vogelbacteria bacterium]
MSDKRSSGDTSNNQSEDKDHYKDGWNDGYHGGSGGAEGSGYNPPEGGREKADYNHGWENGVGSRPDSSTDKVQEIDNEDCYGRVNGL